MRNPTNHNERCEKQMFGKCQGVCKTYSILQKEYAKTLDADPNVKSFVCNVPMEGTSYTSDFYITMKDDSIMVRECIMHQDLVKPRWLALLDTARNYWNAHNVDDWGLVCDKQ